MRSGNLKMPNAAVGQSGMQALYETMFRNYGILVGQVLVTQPDFQNKETRKQLFMTIDELLQLNIIPIINTNDAVSPPPQVGSPDDDGIYNKPPTHDEARIMHTFVPSDLKDIEFGKASDVGTGGMESKVLSALWALENGTSVVICNGMQFDSIRRIFAGERCGSFFTNAEDVSVPVELLAQNARIGSR